MAAWLTHDDFPELMAKSWNRKEDWQIQVPRFQGDVRRWNKEVFGSIFERKSGLMEKLEELDNRIVMHPSPALDREREGVWDEYETVMFQEELLWFQSLDQSGCFSATATLDSSMG